MAAPALPVVVAARPAWHDVLLAVLAAVLGYGLSCLLVAPGPAPLTFGDQWRLMSEAPLELRGQFPHRILAPALAHVAGMGGERFVLFARGLAVLLLAMVFLFCRRRGAAVVDAALVTTAIALTAAVQMYKQHWVGFVDPLCYSLFFACWLAARRTVLFWALFFANLMNHELAAFLLPWLWFVRREVGGDRRADLLGGATALGLYGAFYLWVRAAAPAQKYGADYFAQNPLFPGGTVVVVLLALVHLVVAFGPVLAVLGWHQVRAPGRERWHTWLVVGGVLAIFCIAFDWARHSNLVVLPLVLASVRFLAAGHRALYAGLVALGAALMAWLPPWTSGWPTSALADVGLWARTHVIVTNPATGEPIAGSLRAVLTEWLPEVWPVLAAVLAILAVIWLAGVAFARWRPAPPAVPVTADRAV